MMCQSASESRKVMVVISDAMSLGRTIVFVQSNM